LQHNLRRATEFRGDVPILDQLKNNGTPIPANDIWIAAVAFQQGMQVYTKDQPFIKIN